MTWPLLPLLHAALFGLGAVLLRIVRSWRSTGRSPVAFKSADTAHDFTARCFYLWLPLADLLYVLVYACSGNAGPMLNETVSKLTWLRIAGLLLLVLALVWVLLAQASMGRHWKMGVDQDSSGALCSSGLFALSRHPVYAGIRATMLGQLLLIGSWPMLCLWLLCELLVQLQARFEEAAMLRVHGELYGDYCARVARWL